MKEKLLELFSDREARFDNTKTITLLSLVIGWVVTIITIIKGTPDALYFFITMMTVGGGLTVTKGVVETKQKSYRSDIDRPSAPQLRSENEYDDA